MDIIAKTLKETFNVEAPVAPETSLKDLGLDSLDQIKFLFTLEEKTGVKIPDEDLERYNLERLGQFAEHIDRLRAG
jgi:acyl carrier protein